MGIYHDALASFAEATSVAVFSRADDAYAHENARAAAILSVADGGHGAAIVRHPGSARQSLAAQVFPSGHSGGPLLDSSSNADPPRRADSHCACGNSLGLLE